MKIEERRTCIGYAPGAREILKDKEQGNQVMFLSLEPEDTWVGKTNSVDLL